MMKYLPLVLLVFATSVAAVEPDEMLQDPQLEARARALSQGLRCVVCQNESIDESHAPVARDLRILLRERLLEGDSDEQVIAFIVARYGEYVLLKPRAAGSTWLLWAAGPLMLLGAGIMGAFYLRNRARTSEAKAQALSKQEQARLDEILNRFEK